MPSSYRVTNLIDSLKVQARLLAAEIARLEKALAITPEGRLRINMQRGKARYYHVTPGESYAGHYVSDPALINSLANKRYYTKLIAEYRKELASIHGALDAVHNSQSKPTELIPRGFENLITRSHLGKTDDECADEFLKVQYRTLGFDEWDPEHYSLLKRRTRSKSESDICNCLDSAGVPYRYEEKVVIAGNVFYPDFTCLNKRTRTQYYWEHFGRPTDSTYAERMVSKLNIYRENGIYPGKNLIMTFETLDQPLNVQIINDVIGKYLL